MVEGCGGPPPCLHLACIDATLRELVANWHRLTGELHLRPNFHKRSPHMWLRHGVWGWPEHGRESEALRELVAVWHTLTPGVREKIMELVRTPSR